jgi:hypothetical protein
MAFAVHTADNYYTRNDQYPLSVDEVEAIGLDGTGVDHNERFPYAYANLTDEERAKLNAAWESNPDL